MELGTVAKMQEVINKPNNILDAVAAVSRACSKIDPANKRMAVDKTQISSCNTFLVRAFNNISANTLPKLIWLYVNDISEVISTMLESETQDEFDLTLRQPLIDMMKQLLVNLKLFAGEWYTTHEFDNTTGDYDNILYDIVVTCFNNSNYLGLDKEIINE